MILKKVKNKMKDVQITFELFLDLISYFFPDDKDCPKGYEADMIREQLRIKMQKIYNRDLFTRYKTAKTPAEREQARREYLKERGITQSFISDVEQHYSDM